MHEAHWYSRWRTWFQQGALSPRICSSWNLCAELNVYMDFSLSQYISHSWKGEMGE